MMIIWLLVLRAWAGTFSIVAVDDETWAQNSGCATANMYARSHGKANVYLLTDTTADTTNCRAGLVRRNRKQNFIDAIRLIPKNSNLILHLIMVSGYQILLFPGGEMMHRSELETLFEEQGFVKDKIRVYADMYEAESLFYDLGYVVYPDIPHVSGCSTSVCQYCRCSGSLFTTAILNSDVGASDAISTHIKEIEKQIGELTQPGGHCATMEFPSMQVHVSDGSRVQA